LSKQSHADYIYEPVDTLGKDVVIIVEAKMKDVAVLKYFQSFLKINLVV
jgi:UV DNA damage endonuclease